MRRVSALRLGARVRFEDRWSGSISAIEITEDWEAVNAVVELCSMFENHERSLKEWDRWFADDFVREDRRKLIAMPTADAARTVMQASMDAGTRDTVDFSIVLDHVARSAGITLERRPAE